jgi:hypothetical protein
MYLFVGFLFLCKSRKKKQQQQQQQQQQAD